MNLQISDEKKALIKRHAYSFAKTYATVFLAIYLSMVVGIKEVGSEINFIDLGAVQISASWGLIAVLRNVYKLLDPNDKKEEA